MLLGGILLLALGGAGLFFDHPESWDRYKDLIHGGAIVALVVGGLLVLADITERFSIFASGGLVVAGVAVSEWQLEWMPDGLRPWLLGALIVALAIGAVIFLIALGVNLADESFLLVGAYVALLGIVTLIVDGIFVSAAGWDPALSVFGTALLTTAPAFALWEPVLDSKDPETYFWGIGATVGFAVGMTAVVAVNVFENLATWANVVLIIVAVLGFLVAVGGALAAFGASDAARPAGERPVVAAAEPLVPVVEPQVLSVVSPPVPRSLARLRTQPDGAYRLLPRIE